MIARLRQELHHLQRSDSGRRFRDRHERRREAPRVSRAATMIFGGVLIVAGFLMLALPGPGLVGLLLGLGFLGGELYIIAHWLDRAEVQAARVAVPAIAWWKRLPFRRTIAVIAFLIGCVCTTIITFYVSVWLGTPVPGWADGLVAYLPGL